MNDLQLTIVSPEKTLFSAAIVLVEVPGKKGRFSVLRGHAPIISSLVEGVIRVEDAEGKEHTFECQQGYLEVKNNVVTILLS